MNQTLTSNDRNWATYAHLAGILVFAHIWLANVAGTLAVYFKVRDESPFALQHARDSVNFQLTYTLATFVLLAGGIATYINLILRVATQPPHTHEFPFGPFVWLFVFLGLYLAITVLNGAFCVFGMIAAGNGRPYHYPLAIPFLRR